LVLPVFALGLLTLACSGDGGRILAPGLGTSPGVSAREAVPQSVTAGTVVLGPGGATLRVSGVTVQFASGAVTAPVRVTLEVSATGTSVRLLPDDLTLSSPAVLSVPVAPTSVGSPRLRRLDPVSGAWIEISSVRTPDAIQARIIDSGRYDTDTVD
jgi:hypothetical protein